MDNKEAAELSYRNRTRLSCEKECACYFCCKRFDRNSIVEWVDKEETALCPLCGIDSVVPSYLATDDKLKSLREYWFGKRTNNG